MSGRFLPNCCSAFLMSRLLLMTPSLQVEAADAGKQEHVTVLAEAMQPVAGQGGSTQGASLPLEQLWMGYSTTLTTPKRL
jgi:hypothetical protein